jgi:GntR family transcriptional repressor for pyruvate dehydrogenase complex
MLSLLDKHEKTNRRQRLATEIVTNYIRDLIARGELKRGQRLPPERELVKQIGVSRTTVRAGLQLLAAKGVLVIRHGAGTLVTDGPPVLDSEPLRFLAALHGFSVREMFEARRILEVGNAGLAAERASGEALAAMADEVTNMFASLDDAQAFLIYDIRFHRAVADASDNRILASVTEMVSAIFYEIRRRTAEAGGDPRASAETHRRIYQAIRKHDRPRAEALMREHLLAAEQELEVEQEQEQEPAHDAVDSPEAPVPPKALGRPAPHRTEVRTRRSRTRRDANGPLPESH